MSPSVTKISKRKAADLTASKSNEERSAKARKNDATQRK